MPFCSKCGASLDPQASFCAYCGSPTNVQESSTSLSTTPPVTPPPSYSTTTMPIQRPTGITILAFLACLAGLISVAFGLIFTLFGFGLIFVGIGLIELGVGYGLWTGAPWGWWLGIIGAVLNIISIFSFNVLGFLIGIFMLYYLTRPHVKLWFHRIGSY